MGKALDTITGFVTAPGGTLTAWTLASGDSLQIRNARLDSKVVLLNTWFFNQVAGTALIKSPKMHDNVRGLAQTIQAASVDFGLATGAGTRMYPQDTLTVTQSGSAVGGQIESGSLLVYYDDLPGADARLITTHDVDTRQVDLMATTVAITPGAGGGYSGAAAVNASFDNFIANTDYALLGGRVSARCATVAARGADSANMRVSFPGEPSKQNETIRWFYWLSDFFALPLVPVFNSANKQAITIDIVQNQAAGAVTVELMFARLKAA